MQRYTTNHIISYIQDPRSQLIRPVSDPIGCDNDGDCPKDYYCGDNYKLFFCDDAHPKTNYCSPGKHVREAIP